MIMSQVAALLKEAYGSTFQETLNNEVKLLKYVEKSSRQWDGLRVRYPAHSARNLNGVGARSDNANLPSGGYQGFDDVYVTSAYVYGSFSITGPVLKSGGKNSFATALAAEMELLKNDVVKDVSRQSYGEGLGILAQGYITSTLTSVYIANQFAEPGQPGGRFLAAGQLVDAGTVTSPQAVTTATGQTIVSVGFAANSGTLYDTVTVSASTNMSASAFLFNFNAGGAGVEIKGLRAIVDDQTATNCYNVTGGMYNNSTIFNIDRDTVVGWNADVLQNSGTERLVDRYLVQKSFSNIKKASGKPADIVFGEYEVIDAYLDSLQGDQRFMGTNFDVGEEITHNGKMLVRDTDAPYNEMFLINKEALKWYVLQDIEFADEDGSILKFQNFKDKYDGYVRYFAQLAPGEYAAPNACGVIRDIKTRLA